jgi:GMP synthase-like glutamine amidotransferase
VNIGLLVTGAPPAALQPRFGDYPAMFRALLGEEHAYTGYAVAAGELPADPAAHEAYAITGSACGVYDGDPWITEAMTFLNRAKGRAKLVGICFGHQLMAQAFGGQVEKSAKGWGVGLHTYTVEKHAAWMDEARTIAIPVSHQDQVVELPPAAEVLAGSDFTPNGVLAYRDQPAISFQCHPEFEPAYAKALIENRRGVRYPEAMAEAALASLDAPNDRARVAGWIRRFLAD